MFAYCNNCPVNAIDPQGEFLLTAALIFIGCGVVVGGVMGGMSAAAEDGDVLLGVIEGGLIGGSAAAISFFAPEIGLSSGAAAFAAGGTGALIDLGFQVGEQAGSEEPFTYDWSRGMLATAGAAVATFGIRGLSPQNSLGDAVGASIISADLGLLFGCVDTIIKGSRAKNAYSTRNISRKSGFVEMIR